MKSIDKEIEIVIDNRFTILYFESYVRGFHVQQPAWLPIIDEENADMKSECKYKEKK